MVDAETDPWEIPDFVPEQPPWPVGTFKSMDAWSGPEGPLSAYRLSAALAAGALRMERLGPRRGQWFAATERWMPWAILFNQRVSKRHHNAKIRRVEQALSGQPPQFLPFKKTHLRGAPCLARGRRVRVGDYVQVSCKRCRAWFEKQNQGVKP